MGSTMQPPSLIYEYIPIDEGDYLYIPLYKFARASTPRAGYSGGSFREVVLTLHGLT